MTDLNDLANEIEPFILDVVDPDKDKGEQWLIGLRAIKKPKAESTDLPAGLKGPSKTAEDIAADALKKAKGEDGEDAAEPEVEKVPVYFILRRMPADMSNKLAKAYRDERQVKDLIGNERTEYYFKPEKEQALKEEKARWMLRGSENFVIGIDDDAAAEMYSEALGREVKVGENILLDGHWNDRVRDHYVKRYGWVLTTIMQADRQYNSTLAQRDERLQGNLFRGSNSNSARSGK